MDLPAAENIWDVNEKYLRCNRKMEFEIEKSKTVMTSW